ncbi:50S ribosomal protein L25 [Patescibacteria group bacterium]|nr:50S ribosomal protein L25 [Patescibacteria group bacterium]
MTLELKAKTRQVPTPALNQTREANQIPAELYGHGQTNQHLFVDAKSLHNVYQQAGESSLVDLIIDGQKPFKIIIREVQNDPVSGKIIHVDFQQVKMDEAIEAKITLNFTGESKAVKEIGGTLIKSLEELEVSCLPADLIHDLEVNIDSLNTFDDVIRVKDLAIPEKIKVLIDPEQVIASVAPVHKEEEPKPEEVPAEEGAEVGEETEAKAEEPKPEESKEQPVKSDKKEKAGK